MQSRILVCAGVGCVVVVGLLALRMVGLLDAPAKEPILIRARHDLGYVHPGEIVRHAFAVKNRWERPLRIEKIGSDCGCTSVSIGKHVLAPGEQTSLHVAVQTKDYPEKRRFQVIAEGHVGRTKATFLCELLARAADVIELSPSGASIQFGECEIDQLPKRMEVDIRRGEYPLSWDEMECRSSDPMLDARLIPEGPEQWRLELLLKKPEAYGAFRGALEFVFKSKGVEVPYRYRKAVDANIVGPIVAVPGSLLIGAIGQGESMVRRVEMQHRGGDCGEPIEIISVETAVDGCVEAWIRREAEKQWIEAQFTGRGPDGPRSGVMVVTVKAGGLYRVNVAYLMLVMPAERQSGRWGGVAIGGGLAARRGGALPGRSSQRSGGRSQERG